MDAASWLRALDAAGFCTLRVLLSVLWQSSILLGAAGLLVLLLRRRSPSLRHAVWVAAVCAAPVLPLLAWAGYAIGTPRAELPVMPAYEAPIVIFDVPAVTVPAPLASALPAVQPPADEAFSLADYPWALGLLAYAAAAGAFLVLVLVGRLRIGAWLRRGSPGGGRLAACFDEARQAAGLKRPVAVVESGAAPAPMTVGALRPAVLLPAGLAEGLSDVELRAVAVHEVAHVKRRDPLVLTVVSLVRAVLFFHPLVWLGARQVSNLAEAACDDAVVGSGQEPVFYARLLTRLAEELPRGSVTTELAAGIVLSKRAFLRRVQAILSDRRDRIRRLTRWALAATLFGAVLSLGVALAFPLGERPAAEIAYAPTAEPAEGRDPGGAVAQTPAPVFQATLPNGVTVELVGVSYHPSEGESWWRPDGSPMDERPYDRSDARVLARDATKQKAYEFCVRTAGSQDGVPSVRTEFVPAGGAVASDGSPSIGGRELLDTRAIAATLPADALQCNLRARVAATPWQAAARATGRGPEGVGAEHRMFAFAEAYEGQGEVRIVVTAPVDEADYRVVASLGSGEEVEAGRTQFAAAGSAVQMTAHFPGLSLHEVREYRLDTRRFQWVEFRNVSLSPTHKTDVEVVVEPSAEAVQEGVPAEGGAATTLTFGPVIERVVNDDNEDTDIVIDLDTGRLLSPSKREPATWEERLAWIRANGIDAMCALNPRVWTLPCFDMAVAPVPPERWDNILAGEVGDALGWMAPGSAAFMDAKGELPLTYLFKTREGGVGILQILEVREDAPRGVKIRYKMVQQTPGAGAAEDAEANAAAGPSIQVDMRLLRFTAEGETTLSVPRIVLRDGQTGQIEVVTDRDYVSSPWTPDRPEPETAKAQTGQSWEVTPRIQKTAPDTIAVTISSRLSDVAGGLEGEGLAEVPVVASREWKATVLLKDGEAKTIDIRPEDESGPHYRLAVQAQIVVLPASVRAGGGGAAGFGAPGFGPMLPESDRKVHEHLDDRVSLQFHETPLAYVVEFLKATTGVSYVLFHEDLPPDGAPVTLTIETTLRQALDLICDLTGMDWKVEGGLIKIGAPETLAVYESRVYEVRDLLLSIGDQVPGPGRGARRPVPEEASVSQASLLQRAENLVTLIKETCGRGTWMKITPADIIPVGEGPAERPPAELPRAPARAQPQGRAFVRPGDPGLIVVIQTAEVHRCIEELLQEMRGAPKMQVQLDMIAWVFGARTTPPEPDAPAPERDVEGMLWRGANRRIVGGSGQAVTAVVGSTMLRPVVSQDRRHVFVEVSMSSRVGAILVHTMQDIPDGESRWFVETGPAARMVAAEWMGQEKAIQADLEGCSVALLVRPRIIRLAEAEEPLR